MTIRLSAVRGGRLGRRAGRRVAALIGGMALVLAAAGPAQAEEQPSILRAYGLDWIERIKEEAWPQPKQQRPIICLLDTGVAITPDTPADNPDGPIVARLALEDGDEQGLPQGTTFAHLHGTQMASVIAAPRNGVGTVGVFPQARIVSVRISRGDSVFIMPSDIVAGVRTCRRWAQETVGIAAVVMAESQWEQRSADLPWWQTAAAAASQSGGTLVAAAGNDPNASSVAPLAVADVITVGAGDDAGARCSFAATEQALALRGPGCSAERVGRNLTWPSGSSAATATVGAFLAALATRDPWRVPEDRAQLVKSMVVGTADGSQRVDGTAAAALFPGLIAPPRSEGESYAGLAIGKDTVTEVSAATTPRTVLFRPRVGAKWGHGRLALTRMNRKRAGVLRVLPIGVRRSDAYRCTKPTCRLQLKRRPRELLVWAESKKPGVWRSLTARAKVR